MPDPGARPKRALLLLPVRAVVAAASWPVREAGFVWDDFVFLRDTAELRQGDNWTSVVLHGFSDWSQYFRPFGVAFWMAEARWLDLTAERLHTVSLGIHLLNTLLVGLLGRMVLRAAGHSGERDLTPPIAAALFGLHPLLVEPVVWISSQCELILTFFTLLALAGNLAIRSARVRAAATGACFFLAACTKETAVSIPILIVIFDWLLPRAANAAALPAATPAARFREQLPVYAAILAAGIAYLFFRGWSLGVLVPGIAHDGLPPGTRLQMACFAYLSYWKLLVWPMSGLGPLHLFSPGKFGGYSIGMLATDAGALAIASAGLVLLWNRQALGGLIAAATAPLLPVLHLVPIPFDDGLYHDRYAMTSAAMICALLPLVVQAAHRKSGRLLRLAGGLIAALWLTVAIINIRVTVPLWSDEVRLWQWALRQNPGSIIASDNLLSAYLERNDLAAARPLVDQLMASRRECVNCMLNVAQFGIVTGDDALSEAALTRARSVLEHSAPPRRLTVLYLVASGNLHRLRGEWDAAEADYRSAIAAEPLDPNPYMNLAVLLARRGRTDDARRAADSAIALYPSDERQARRRQFERLLEPTPETGVSRPPASNR